jgi:hypothetical protein
VYSRWIVSWQLAGNMRTDLVLDALRMALSTRSRGADCQLIHHTDQGWQLAIVEWVAWYNDARLHSSLGNRTPAETEAAWVAVNSCQTEEETLQTQVGGDAGSGPSAAGLHATVNRRRCR